MKAATQCLGRLAAFAATPCWQARRFVERKIRPFHAEWEEQGIAPTAL